ncbi:putative protoheme IX farnesyltransferase [Streptomyces afghaniensis 772] [Streptomyces afghaniensis]
MANSRVYPEAKLTNQQSETSAWKDFLALIKIGIVNSNLITVFTGIWLAIVFTDAKFLEQIDTVLYTLIGSGLIMAGSCVLNNFIDRDIDPLMERTKSRPTVTGKVKPAKVAVLGFGFLFIGTLFLLLTTITATVIALIGAFSYVVVYTMWTKRRLVSNTVIGSFSGAFPPLIGWATIDPGLHVMAWSLFLIMFVWQPPHFYSLAIRRAEEYRAAGIPMLPVVKGFEVAKRHTYIWIIALFPLPFLLYQIGIPFLILATLLNIGWVITGIRASKKEDEYKWATAMFIYSIQYLTILFVSMVVFTLF